MLSENNMEKLIDITEGNPGFITAFMEVLPHYVAAMSTPKHQDDYIEIFIDYLKSKELTGSKLWVLFKDVCNKSAEDMLLKLMEDGLVVYIGKHEPK